MHRIDGPTAAPGGFWTEGNPVGGVPATIVSDDWMNDVQENIIGVLTAASIAPIKGDYTQLAAAIAALIAASTSDPLNTTRIDVASAGTVNLTTGAPNTRHINITGTTTITGFTVAVGKCYFVRFNASLTLTNGASLVTQSGANIVTQAGDTCVIRATAANVIEVLCYTPGIPQATGYLQTRQDVKASRIAGTVYTNNTGRPIEFTISSINTGSSGGSGLEVTVGSIVYVAQPTQSIGPNNISATITVTIRNGETYKYAVVNAIVYSMSEIRT